MKCTADRKSSCSGGNPNRSTKAPPGYGLCPVHPPDAPNYPGRLTKCLSLRPCANSGTTSLESWPRSRTARWCSPMCPWGTGATLTKLTPAAWWMMMTSIQTCRYGILNRGINLVVIKMKNNVQKLISFPKYLLVTWIEVEFGAYLMYFSLIPAFFGRRACQCAIVSDRGHRGHYSTI